MKNRYGLCPQMKEYDTMGVDWTPYVMFTNKKGYIGDYVATNQDGFRITYNDRCSHNEDGEEDYKTNIFIGGSTAFGVGATDDYLTIPSLLDGQWLNLAGRAYFSTQEYLHFLFNLKKLGKIDKVVIMSGLNNLIMYYLSNFYSLTYGTFFYHDLYATKMRESSRWRTLKNSLCPEKADNNFRLHKSIVTDILERDIGWWKLLSQVYGFKLYYFLQPFANWTYKEFCNEEQILFEELDNKSKQWKVLASEMDEDYEWFTKSISDICINKNITYTDLNYFLLPDNDWLFVDRVHLTDKGNEIIADIIERRIS